MPTSVILGLSSSRFKSEPPIGGIPRIAIFAQNNIRFIFKNISDQWSGSINWKADQNIGKL